MERDGVFFFEPVTGGMVERCFAPRAAVRRFTLGAPVGEMLVADSKLGRDKIQAAIREQEQLRGQRLGELLAEEGAVSREEISAALKRQKNMPVMRLGEFLRESKIISDAQLEAALARQAENLRVPLGEILALREGALPPDDRLIQLVGEFEADVNNGGFGQYLSNKGAARAREALECLSAIGAKRTSRWLTSALEGRLGKDGLARLDQQFNEKAEDFASLATTYIGRRQ